MRWKAVLAGLALARTAAPAGADSPPLAGRYDALVEAAGAAAFSGGREA